MSTPAVRRIVAVAMWAVAIAWGVVVARMAMVDEREPPIGALAYGIPAFALFVGAGFVWPSKQR